MRTSSKIAISLIFLPVFILATIQFSGVYQFYIVMSNSTAPAYQTGDIVLLDKHLDFANYKVGDAVLYSPPDFNEIVIHKIYDIKVVNGTYYFAIKGDANPQPDTVPQSGNITNELLANRTVTWSTFYNGQNVTNPTAPYVIASYYPAKEVVLGRVIYKIPVIGWLFVPFQSPLTDPFHILPLSLFSIFTVYYAILVVVSFFVLMNKANFELKKLLNSLAVVPLHSWKPDKIKISNFYSMVIYPLILFGLIFFSATPVPVVINNQISLQSSSVQQVDNTTITKLVYHQQMTVSSISINQNNQSITTMYLKNNKNTIDVNLTRDSVKKGQNINTAEPYSQIDNVSYKLRIDRKSMFVESSSKANVPELGLFFDYAVPTTNTTPIGLMTQNVFLRAYNSNFNKTPAYETKLNFSFIQDLISYTWNVRAFFNQSTGYLLYLQVHQTQSLWAVPEITGLITIVVASIIIYNTIKYEFQKLFNEKQEKIINAQMKEAKERQTLTGIQEKEEINNTEKDPQFLANPDEHQKEEEKENNDNSSNDKPKKLSWEEYKKLEDQE